MALVVGAVTSIAAPAAMGALIPVLGLPAMLVLVATAVAMGAIILAVLPKLRAGSAGGFSSRHKFKTLPTANPRGQRRG